PTARAGSWGSTRRSRGAGPARESIGPALRQGLRLAYAEGVTGDSSTALSASRVANVAAPAILEAFEGWPESVTALTRRAKRRFELQDWKGAAADATERLDLYGRAIDEIESGVRAMLGARVSDRLVWAGMKAVYSGLIAGREDWELAETFFSSVTRRVFTT